MRRLFILLFFLTSIVSMSCQAILPTSTITSTYLPSRTPTGTLNPIPTTTPTVTRTSTPIPATSTPTVTSTPLSAGFTVQTHPDGNLYVGDLVSIEVISPEDIDVKDSEVAISVNAPKGETIDALGFGNFGIGGRSQATFTWAWDTLDLEPGEHTLTFTIEPQDITWEQTVNLYPAEDMPIDEIQATWAMTTSECCAIHYIMNTAAERDLDELVMQAGEEAQQAVDQMGIDFSETITITILPRLLGHGGFASDEIHVTYIDRNYASSNWEMVLHHEMVHILDRRIGGEFRPSLLVEGLAVYLSGGHYKPEPIFQRAAGLLDDRLELYLPLESLADDFYAAQHEIGYIEAGSLIAYMVERWGWDAFTMFYRDIHPHPSEKQSAAIDTATQVHFGLTFEELENEFIIALRNQPITDDTVKDVQLTVEYFDTLRRYQRILDPSAYFRTAWLVDTKRMRQEGIVADYFRHPDEPENLALEAMLLRVGKNLGDGRYAEAEMTLLAINSVLEMIENPLPASNPFDAHPIAADYLAIAYSVDGAGYQLQQVNLDGDKAFVIATFEGPELFTIDIIRQEGKWEIKKIQGRTTFYSAILPWIYN
jgi:hypothetical protein